MKIEKGVPIPDRRTRSSGKCPYPFDRMEMGDCLVIDLAPNDTMKRLAARVRQWCVKAGKNEFSVVMRAADNALRVWKIAYVAPPPRKARPKPLAGIAAAITGAPRVHRLADDEPKRGRRAAA